jgi:hypothetical protein
MFGFGILRMFGLGILRRIFPRGSTRELSARPPTIPAAAAVPTSAGTAALREAVPTVPPTFSAAEPTVPPTLPAAEPTLSPTPLSAPVTPLLDCDLVDLRGRELRDLLAAADERVDLRARVCAGDRLLGVRLDDAFALGVRLDDAFALGVRFDDAFALGVRFDDAFELRVGALPLRLVDPDRRAARRVLVWAMSPHLPRIATSPAVGRRHLPGPTLFESWPPGRLRRGCAVQEHEGG